MKQNISVTRARTHRLKLRISGPDGEPYILKDGEKIIFGVKKNLTDSEYVIKKVITEQDSTDYTCSIDLDPADTEVLSPAMDYYYDVGLQSGTAYYSVIDSSKFYLNANVTKKEA